MREIIRISVKIFHKISRQNTLIIITICFDYTCKIYILIIFNIRRYYYFNKSAI